MEIQKQDVHIPYQWDRIEEMEMRSRSRFYFELMSRRRTVRDFSEEPVSREVIQSCLMAGSTAPSGANKQPYEFVCIESEEVKSQIHRAAEHEEYLFYNERAPQTWLDDLKPFKTCDKKPYLKKAPCLVAIFSKPFEYREGVKQNNYYSIESTGLAAGMAISALHFSGLSCLTYTPSPMKFMNKILDRPSHYRCFLVLVVGYPEKGALVPNQRRKESSELIRFK